MRNNNNNNNNRTEFRALNAESCDTSRTYYSLRNEIGLSVFQCVFDFVLPTRKLRIYAHIRWVVRNRRQTEMGLDQSYYIFTSFTFLFIWRCRFFRVFFLYNFHFLFVWRVRRTFFPSGWCFFYLVTTGWIFDISLLCCCCCCHPICCLRRNVSLDTLLKTLQPGSQHTVERPHILPTAVHALNFYREKGPALPIPRRC